MGFLNWLRHGTWDVPEPSDPYEGLQEEDTEFRIQIKEDLVFGQWDWRVKDAKGVTVGENKSRTKDHAIEQSKSLIDYIHRQRRNKEQTWENVR